MRVFGLIVAGLLACPVLAHADSDHKAMPEPAPQKVSNHDTVKISVEAAPAKNQVRLDVFVVNTEPVAGLPLPLKVTSASGRMKFDSAAYAGGRVEYFQLKSHNADTANQTILVGLIADLSGSKPPLAPGRGKALSLFYTGSADVTPDQVKVEAVTLPPANKLEFNTIEADGSVGSTIPTYVRAKAQKAAPAEKQ